MLFKRKFLTIVAVVATALALPVQAAGWTQAYSDYYVGGNNKVLGLEGGMHGAYGFIEQDLSADTTFAKVNRHDELYKGISVYTQGSYFGASDFDEFQGTIGLGYTGFAINSGYFKPWIGFNVIDNTFSDDTRGLVGWTAGVSLGEGQSIYNWTELGLDKVSANGAIGFQQDFGKNLYGALQYRYMYGDAGAVGYADEAMLRVGYKFN